MNNKCSAIVNIKTPIVIVMIITLFSFAGYTYAEGVDMLAEPLANAFATFKATGTALLILIQFIAAARLYQRNHDYSVFVGVFVVAILTAWVSTKI